MLDAARRAGEPPSSYAPLLRQYYVVRAAQRAGIDLDDWDPAAGAQHNRDTIERVYRYYAKLFLMDDRLEWAGMANLVGPSFAAGFLDLHMVRELAAELDERVGDLPGPVQERLPPEVLGLAALSDLGEDELAFYERTLLAMQKEIFFDAGTMHEAYLERGLEGIEELRDAQIVDGQAVGAWQRIDRGAPEDVATATELLADREQNLTIADEYDDMRARFPTGPAMTYLMTVVGDPSIPGTKTPGEFSQLEVTGPWVRLVPVPPVGPGVEGRVVVTTSLPDFNIADRANRWRMITDDTLPAYRRLVDEQPESLRALVGADVGLLIEDNRLRQRWPRLVEDLRRGWALDPDVRGVAW
jgi:hypothetical protein